MSIKIKVGGIWKDSTLPYIKIAGVWKIAKAAYRKVDGVWRNWFLQGGVLDAQFAAAVGAGPNDRLRLGVVAQPDGKIIVHGSFTQFNGIPANSIIRLNENGTIDTTFLTNIGTGTPSMIVQVVLQPDGKMILRGEGCGRLSTFISFNNTPAPGIVRLNEDGTIDTDFMANVGTGFPVVGPSPCSALVPNSFALQADGKIVIGGGFMEFNGVAARRIMRLNADGTRDTGFSQTHGTGIASFPVLNVYVRPNGKIVATGTFRSFNGITANSIIRFNPDGSLDSLFSTNTGTGCTPISAIAFASDEKIYISSSSMTSFNGTAVPRIVRLNEDGTIDTTFLQNIGTGSTSNAVSQIIEQVDLDNKIIVVGVGSTFNGLASGRIVRLNSNGTNDVSFINNARTATAVSSILQTVFDKDQKLLVPSTSPFGSRPLIRIGIGRSY
jgi:uncharacterized delta-60 repeat protein